MSRLRVRGFRGEYPRLGPRLLDDHAAQISENVDHTSVGLDPWSSKAVTAAIAKTGTIKTIYYLNESIWLHWTDRLRLAKSPISGDVDEKTYFTGPTLDAPRVTSLSLADSSMATAGVITGATQTNPVRITDVAHGLSTGIKFQIDNVVGMTELNGQQFFITVIDDDTLDLDGIDGTAYTAYISGGTWDRILNEFPEDSYKIGVPAPTNAPTAALSGVHTTPVDTAYVYTYVNAWGEESAPSPVSNIVAADHTSGSVDLTTMDAAPSPSLDYAPITTWRIYRIASSLAGSEYQFVADVTINISSPQYNDAIDTSDLGEALLTTLWDVPPTTLDGITLMANGIMAGFTGNDVYFSETFIPYAWPETYKFTTDHDIIGLGTFGQTLVVLTKSYPYLISGTDPSQMSMKTLSHRQPCTNIDTIVALGDGVAYSSPDGVFMIGESGARSLSEKFLTRKQWQALGPDNAVAGQYDNRYMIFFNDINSARIIDPISKEYYRLNIDAQAVYSSPVGDKLYYAFQDPDTLANEVDEFNAGGSSLTLQWKSRIFNFPHGLVFSAGQIFGDYSGALTAAQVAALNQEITDAIARNAAKIAAGNTLGDLNGSALNTFELNGDDLEVIPAAPSSADFLIKIYGDGTLVHESNVANTKPFRVSSDGNYVEVEIEIYAESQMEEVILATSIKELMK